MRLYSDDLERKLLSILIKKPILYADIATLIDDEDFYTGEPSSTHGRFVNQTIFRLIKHAHDKDGDSEFDPVILIERLRASKVSFSDNIDAADYINSLTMARGPYDEASLLSIAKELKNYTIRRTVYKTGSSLQALAKNPQKADTVPAFLDAADSLYHAPFESYTGSKPGPENIFDDMEANILHIASNPQEAGMLCPHLPFLNNQYGSLFRPGNITVIAAPSGGFKTTLTIDLATKVSHAHGDVPILHMDNGEMSKKELQNRMAAALSGVPLSLIENGKWAQGGYTDYRTNHYFSAEEVRVKLEKTWQDINSRKFFYYSVANHTVDQMLTVARRFYLREVKRGNPMILSFDYIKHGSEKNSSKASWEVVGEIVNKFKSFIQDEIKHNGDPMISMITGVQTNREYHHGVEDPSIISLSSQIEWFATHLFLLRKRTDDEVLEEPQSYSEATHCLVPFKWRHGGEDSWRISPKVSMPALDDGGNVVGVARLRTNSILLKVENFNITEFGDVREMANQMRVGGIRPNEDGE